MNSYEDNSLLPSQRMTIERELIQVKWWAFLLLLSYDFDWDKVDAVDKEYIQLHMQYVAEHDTYH